MQIQNTQNSINFGIKYIRPKKWSPEVLDTLMNSNLVKEIDSKYPYAKVRYRGPSKRLRDETLFMCGQAKEGYLYFVLDKKIKPIYDSLGDKMTDCIKKLTLDKLEGRILSDLEKEQRKEDIFKAAKESNRRTSVIEHIKSLFW